MMKSVQITVQFIIEAAFQPATHARELRRVEAQLLLLLRGDLALLLLARAHAARDEPRAAADDRTRIRLSAQVW